MARPFQVADLLLAAAPGGMCAQCIRDRMPLLDRAHQLRSVVADPRLHKSAGECVGCMEATDVFSMAGLA